MSPCDTIGEPMLTSTKWLTIFGLAITFAARGIVAGTTPPTTATSDEPSSGPATSFKLTLDFEDLDDVSVLDKYAILLNQRPLRSDTRPAGQVGQIAALINGENTLDLSVFPDGKHYLYLVAKDFAPQWFVITIAGDRVTPASTAITLYRTRYVIIRYAFSRVGKDLTGTSVRSGRVAVTHFTGPPDFDQDWMVWQADKPGSHSFGPIPVIQAHRIQSGYGFAMAPEHSRFEALTTAPADDNYRPRSFSADPGLIFFSRVNGNLKAPKQLGYGKILVEDVTTTRPSNVQVLEWQPRR
jgi:hypothetical protein